MKRIPCNKLDNSESYPCPYQTRVDHERGSQGNIPSYSYAVGNALREGRFRFLSLYVKLYDDS